MNRENPESSRYEEAGVSIDRGNALINRIRSSAVSTHNRGVMGSLGGFGALFDLSRFDFKDPVLVSGTDGAGTKIKLAIDQGIHNSIGIDLVAMCANDLVVQGAEPLFFLDYFATSRLDVDTASTVIDGIAAGCRLAGCALIGGETAEMPGMYQPGEYDLAGFCVGAVERDAIIDGSSVREGDVLVALASSGPHANGYSLIRKVIADTGTGYDMELNGRRLGDWLLEPTRIYVRSILSLLQSVNVRALAHITGGGLSENIPRVIPDGLDAELDTGSWCIPPVFCWLQQAGKVDTDEMFRTFNCGVGMVICVAEDDLAETLRCLASNGETAWKIGQIRTGNESSSRVIYI
ncbi:MAG: phosphoribosylformylglycinamidine cyclo-ligase [Gammaproteobacteria bacterium]|nr:phosphoribosylformylglycinamidine cyclo-ligase [Gammaproteobacteria bacterium]